MSPDKKCGGCMARYSDGHWAAERDRCPACGAALVGLSPVGALRYEHVDSSALIHFDLADLLSARQAKETKTILGLGLGLLLLGGLVRLGFVVLGGLDAFWTVPLWFDAIVLTMLVLAVSMVVWSWLRLRRHRKALQR